MLVLTRRINEKIIIATDIVVTILNVDGDQVKVGVEAPRDVSIHRQEIFDDILKSNRAALLQRKNQNDVLLGIINGKVKNRQ
jgi:carbon storage regulator